MLNPILVHAAVMPSQCALLPTGESLSNDIVTLSYTHITEKMVYMHSHCFTLLGLHCCLTLCDRWRLLLLFEHYNCVMILRQAVCD